MIDQVQWLLEIPVPQILRFVLNRLWWCSKPTIYFHVLFWFSSFQSLWTGFPSPLYNFFTWYAPLLFLVLLLRFFNQQSNYYEDKLCSGVWTRVCIVKPLYVCILIWLCSVVDILWKYHPSIGRIYNSKMYLLVCFKYCKSWIYLKDIFLWRC